MSTNLINSCDKIKDFESKINGSKVPAQSIREKDLSSKSYLSIEKIVTSINKELDEVPPVVELNQSKTGDNINPRSKERQNDNLIFVPTWDNKPEEQANVISLNGKSILSQKNTAAIIAAPGFGKSSVCEAVVTSYINRDADCLGLLVDQCINGIIYVDFERTNIDVWNSFYRIARRAGISKGKTLNNVLVAGMRSIPRLGDRLKALEGLLNDNSCGLLILDGAGDMVTDTNDLLQSIECRIFLRELTVKYNLSILTTLHPNPNSFKPRGHIGSEILREAESVLVIKNFDSYRILTTDFEHGKNRNNSIASSAYSWSDENKMFVSIDVADIKTAKVGAKDLAKRNSTENLCKNYLCAGTSYAYTDLLKIIMQKTNKSKSTVKRMLDDSLLWGIIKKGTDGNYRL